MLDDDKEYQLVTAKRSRGGIVPRERLKGHAILTKTQFEVLAGDFLISRRQIIHGACGVVPASLEGAIVSNEYATLRPRDGLLTEYLQYLTHTSYFQRTCFHSSVGVDVEKMVFKLDDWMRFPVHLPLVSEQRRIASILSSVDNTIEATQSVIDQVQVVKRTMMAELLTRGVLGRHTRFKQTEIGEVPEGWEVVRLGRVVGSLPGFAFPSERFSKNSDDGLPLVRIRDLHRQSPEVFIEGDHPRDYEIDDGAILVGMDGDFEAARWSGGHALLNQRVCRLWVSDRNSLDDGFLFYRVQPELDAIHAATGRTTVKHLSTKHLVACMVTLPPLPEQQMIAATLDALTARNEAERVLLDALQGTKLALMSVLLTGEVRVTPDENKDAA